MATSRRMAIGVSIVLSALAVRGAAQDPPVQTFHSTAAAVSVDVTVRDGGRRPITGLGPSDFHVLDNGVAQHVTDVGYEKLPIDVTVALDVSYSVTGDTLRRLRQAVAQLMRDLRPADRLRLTMFNMRVTETMGFTRDTKEVERAIRAAAARGGTALLDTVSVGLASAMTPDRRHLIVVFTDGSDTSSTTSGDVLMEVARHTRATVTFVVPTAAPLRTTTIPGGVPTTVFVERLAPAPALPLMPLLSSVSQETGGSVLPIVAGSSLSSAFRRTLEEFRSAYVLYYTPTGVDRTGYHQLDVTVERKNAVVRARRGYFSR